MLLNKKKYRQIKKESLFSHPLSYSMHKFLRFQSKSHKKSLTYHVFLCILIIVSPGVISSAGRAPALQAGCRRFEPVIAHQT